MALGRKASAEPLSSEDMALLVGGRGAGGDGARERPALSPAPHQGRRARADAAVQREHPRVAERRPGWCSIATTASCAGTARWKSSTASVTRPRSAGRSTSCSTRRIVRHDPRLGATAPPKATAHLPHPDVDPARAGAAAAGQPRRPRRCATRTRDVVGSIVIVEDISTRVQLEEQLQISEKMASIGLLAAGVAHEVNTPLTGISSFTQMLLEGADPRSDDPVLEKIERQTFRAAKIVNGLLNLARPAQVDERRRAIINAVVNDVLSLLEHQFRTGSIQVRKELARRARRSCRGSSTSCSRCSSTCS